MEMQLRNLGRIAGPDQSDHVRPRQPVARLDYPEVPVLRVSPQTIGLEIFIAVMADCDALFRRAPHGSRGERLRLAMFRFDGGSLGGPGGVLARRLLFLRCDAGRGSRLRLLL